MADRFYVNCPLGPGLVQIDGPEAHHLAAVRRLGAGDAICLFNGDGCEYPAVVEAVQRRQVTVHVTSVQSPKREPGMRLEIAAPVPKGDRAQFLIEKLTEIGATTFVPLRTRRSVVHPHDAKIEKLERYVIEACKQSGRNTLVQIRPLVDWETYCRLPDLPEQRFVAHPGGEVADPRPGDIALAVGPEGGFVDQEVAAARAAGWRVVSLGPRMLRVETAALVLATLATFSNPASAGP
jgi:16S rRNA (uracil1498-N3)-methyltransferase